MRLLAWLCLEVPLLVASGAAGLVASLATAAQESCRDAAGRVSTWAQG